MTQVNLLPSDVKQKARTRQVTVLVGVAVGIILAALIGLFVLESGKLASANNDLTQANAQNAALQEKDGKRLLVMEGQGIAYHFDKRSLVLKGQLEHNKRKVNLTGTWVSTQKVKEKK